jgi:MinD-like ATPase involved in chromosome partitioning or flagellar assembly
MFTVEEEFDESIVTILDNNGQYEDITMYFSENGVYIVQYNEKTDSDAIIELSTEMWETMIEAYNRTNGTYIVST